MLEAIDKYKFGLIAALGVYIVIFMYLTMGSYKEYFVIEGFEETTGELLSEQEVPLKPENVQLPSDFNDEVLNMANNVADNRETSLDQFYENKTPAQVAQDIKALEKQMEADAGGAKERAKLQAMIDARKEQKDKMEKAAADSPKATDGGETKTSKKTMVDFDLQGRDAYQNNKWYVRNPGYGCDNKSQVTVLINIKVNATGSVTSASYNAGKSRGASSCEIDKALKYAKMSRFEYKSSGGQTGWIQYTFMPQ
jgi:hypothetical protein